MTDERLAEIEKYVADEMDPVYPDVTLAVMATELVAEVRRLRAWEQAVTNALVVAEIYEARHDADPRQAVHELCVWEGKIAVDPAVSSDARDLQAAERRLCVGAAESAYPSGHGRACGCGECTGVTGAVDAINNLPGA